MKTLQYPMTVFLLAMIFFPSYVILAQNQTPPEIEFDHPSYSTKSMGCNFYHTGKISTSNQEYDKVSVIVNDSSANKFSTSIDKVTVSVWSDSDKKGIEIVAYETGVNSGVFEGKFTISDGQSTQDSIHVINGDTLSARYSSLSSLPLGSPNHDVTTTSLIGMSCPPFERVPASSLGILDTKGNERDVTTVGSQVLITSNITNPTGENQNFTYIVQVQDQNGSTASLAWLSGTMLQNQASSPSVSWTPSKAGNYVVNVFVWQSLTNPNALSPPLSADLTVLHDFANSKSSISDAKNLHCNLGFELMAKPTDGSPVCVTPGTAQKLVQRGWATNASTSNHVIDAKTNDPFGITALIIYHPPDLCLNSSHSIPSGMPSCPPNKFYLKINSNSAAYLMGYNICVGTSCATNNNLSLILPLNTGLNPSYQMIGLPVNLQWRYGDTVGIQLYVSSTNNSKTASLVDLGNSAIVP